MRTSKGFAAASYPVHHSAMSPDADEDRAQSALRLFTMAYLILGIATAMTSSAEPDVTMQGPRVLVLLAGVVVFLGTVIAGTVGLLMLKRWGLWVHLASTVTSISMVMVLGDMLLSGFEQAISFASSISAGGIYGVGFFTRALPR